MSDSKPDFAAAFVDIRLSDDATLLRLNFFDAEAKIPHVVTLPTARLENLRDQVLHKIHALRPDAPRV